MIQNWRYVTRNFYVLKLAQQI